MVTVTGTLKGYDQLLNLVLDEAVEFLRGNLYNRILVIVCFLLVCFWKCDCIGARVCEWFYPDVLFLLADYVYFPNHFCYVFSDAYYEVCQGFIFIDSILQCCLRREIVNENWTVTRPAQVNSCYIMHVWP